MRFNATQEDFLRGQLIDKGYHPSTISESIEETSKGGTRPDGTTKDKVQMLVLTFKIVAGPAKDQTVKVYFPENAPANFVTFMEAAGFIPPVSAEDKKKGVALDASPSQFLGKNVDILIGHKVSDKDATKKFNSVEGYRPFSLKAPVS